MGTAEDTQNESSEKMTDYPNAIDMSLPTNFSFDSCTPLSIVIHETGGEMSLDAVQKTFLGAEKSNPLSIDQKGGRAEFLTLLWGGGGECYPKRDAIEKLLCAAYTE